MKFWRDIIGPALIATWLIVGPNAHATNNSVCIYRTVVTKWVMTIVDDNCKVLVDGKMVPISPWQEIQSSTVIYKRNKNGTIEVVRLPKHKIDAWLDTILKGSEEKK